MSMSTIVVEGKQWKYDGEATLETAKSIMMPNEKAIYICCAGIGNNAR